MGCAPLVRPSILAVAAVVALGVAGVALVVLGVVTARRPAAPVPATLDGYFALWQPLHGGYDPRSSFWVRGWLRMAYAVGRPLARFGVQPDVLTLAGTWLAFAVLVMAGRRGGWAMVAGWVVIASGLLDAIDGCVAVLSDRATRWGYVLDSALDRVGDVVLVAAVVAAGGHPLPAYIAGAAFLELEYIRARARNAGGDEIGVVTVGERAVRAAFASAGIFWSAVFRRWEFEVATLALGILAVLSLVGLVQMVVATRRQLTRMPAA